MAGRKDSRLHIRRTEDRIDRALGRLFAALEDGAMLGIESRVALVVFSPQTNSRRTGECAFAENGRLFYTSPTVDMDRIVLGVLRDSQSPDCAGSLTPEFVRRYRQKQKGRSTPASA